MKKRFYVVQEGMPEPLWFDRYSEAMTEGQRLAKEFPEKQLGVFLFGSQSSLFWNHGHGHVPWASEAEPKVTDG